MTTDTGRVLPAEADTRYFRPFTLFRVHSRLAMIAPTMRTTSPRFNLLVPAPAQGMAGHGRRG